MTRIQSVAVIDDDALVRRSMASLLRSLGLAAVTFESADAYLRHEPTDRFACIISDVQMPGLSGIQLLRLLGNDAPPLPVIMMTAFADDRVRFEALEAGAICFIEKPVDGDRLVECLEAVFGKLGG